MAHELIGIRIVLRKKGHADTGRHLQAIAINDKRTRGGFQQPLQHRQAILLLIQINQDSNELVATNA